ncbi:protein translocase subunit SecF [Paenibacillus tarimensis]
MRYKFENVDFVKLSRFFFTFSIAITVLGVLTLAIFGLKYGVDFRAGSSIDIAVTKQLDKTEIEGYLNELDYGKYNLTVGAERTTIRFENVVTDVQEEALKTGFAERFDPNASAEVNTVDVTMAKELQRNAMIAVALASIGIIAYVSIRFEWRFALAAIVALLHDAFIVISLFSILRLEVNLPFIVAVLTIIGYSINDTIVIFDRIRENLRFAKIKSISDIAAVVNRSIAETMTRSINTVATVFAAALCLFIFADSIRLFSLAMLLGLVSGAYSSIFIASPLWLLLRSKAKPKSPAKTPAASP